MAKEELTVVLGATGHTGRVAAETLLKRGRAVRAVARDADKLSILGELGACTYPGTLDSEGSMAKALEGATSLYLALPQDVGQDDLRAFTVRAGETILETARRAGARHVVMLSCMGADRTEGTGPIAGLREVEDMLRESSDFHSRILRPGYFMENHLHGIQAVKRSGLFASPLKPDMPLPQVAARDVGWLAADLLDRRDFTGHEIRYQMGPRDLTMREAAGILGKAIDKPDIRYGHLPKDAVLKMMVRMGISERTAGQMVEMNEAYNSGWIRPTQPRSAENATRTSIEVFASRFAAAYRAG